MDHKTLRICNLRKMDRLRTKLVSLLLLVAFTALGEHTSLLSNMSIFRTLQIDNILKHRYQGPVS